MRQSGVNGKLAVAALLIVLGVAAFAYEGLLYATHRGDWEGGGLHADGVAAKRVPMPLIIGAVALVGGLAVLFVATESVHRTPAAP